MGGGPRALSSYRTPGFSAALPLLLPDALPATRQSERPMTGLSIAMRIAVSSSHDLQFFSCGATLFTPNKPKNLTFFKNPAFPNPQHAGGAAACELFIVGRYDQCAPIAQQSSQQIPKFHAPSLIQRRCRFVHEQKRRIDGEGPGDGDPLRFPTRQFPRQRGAAMLPTQPGKQPARPALGLAQRYAVRMHRRKPHVFDRRQVLEQMMKLKKQTHLAPRRAHRYRRMPRATVYG